MEKAVVTDNTFRNRIIESHLPEEAFPDNEKTFRPRREDDVVDTLIIHSIYLHENILAPSEEDSDFFRDSQAKELYFSKIKKLKESIKNAKNKEATIAEMENLQGLALRKFLSCNDETLQQPLSLEGIKLLFVLSGISAHYIIDQEGRAYELVSPTHASFHSGNAQMPLKELERESINYTSIGVELLASPDFPITEAQYQTLAELVKHLKENFKLKNFYGHSDIAPGRKTDPEGFNWKRFVELAGLGDGDNYPA